MDTELRIYRLRDGELDRFVAAWRRHVLPLRARFGFRVLGSWQHPDANEFVWQLAYDGPEGIAERERQYADARALEHFEDDPAQYVESAEVRFLRPLPDP
jgi:hypothetical protein